MRKPRQYLSWKVVITRLLFRNISNSQDLETGVEFMTYRQRDVEHKHLQSTSSFCIHDCPTSRSCVTKSFRKNKNALLPTWSSAFSRRPWHRNLPRTCRDSPVDPNPSREPLHHQHLKQDTALPHPLDSVHEKLAWKASEEPDPRGPKLQVQHAVSKHGADETPTIPQ